MSSVDVSIDAATLVGAMNTNQAFCDALVDRCEDHGVSAQRIAAALVLLASVDDELQFDLEAAPAALRAVFDEA